MLGEEGVKRIAETALLSAAEADQVEVAVYSGISALTRFANNYNHQNVEESDTSITVRAVLGKKIGVATTDVITPEGLKAVANRAVSLARLQTENPDFVSLPAPTAIEKVDAFVERTATFTPEQRAAVVGQICATASRARLVAAGAFRTASGEIALA